jgi:hypothetical protein
MSPKFKSPPRMGDYRGLKRVNEAQLQLFTVRLVHSIMEIR